MHFGEYELFLSLISLSPLPTVHPSTFQRTLVRSFIPFYRYFNLTMGRSLSFASTPTNLSRIKFGNYALFRLAFASASPMIWINLASEE
jgi:hypothetical protein